MSDLPRARRPDLDNAWRHVVTVPHTSGRAVLAAGLGSSGGHCRVCLLKIAAIRDAQQRGDVCAEELHAEDLAVHRATAHPMVTR